MAKRGIPARFDGDCPACGVHFDPGEIVEKIPQYNDARGHLDCYLQLNGGNARPSVPAQRAPQTAAPANVTPHPSSRPATQGPRAAAPPASGFTIALDDETIHDLWQMHAAFTQAAQGNMKAAVCLESILKRIDPHQAKAAPSEQERRAS